MKIKNNSRKKFYRSKQFGLCSGILIMAAINQPVFATSGYSPTGFGTINKGMVGAGVALPQDAMTAATNPAGMALVGHRWDAGAALFSPSKRGYTANDTGDPSTNAIVPGDYISENNLFLVPHFGWNTQLTDTSTLGVSVGGNGGMNTEYDSAVFANFGAGTAPTGVDFSQLFVGVTYAQSLNDNNWIGIMPILAVQQFEAT